MPFDAPLPLTVPPVAPGPLSPAAISGIPRRPKRTLRVIVFQNPFDPAERQIIDLRWGPRKTVAQYLAGLPEGSWSAIAAGRELARAEWGTTTLTQEDAIVLIANPEKGVGRILAMVAVLVVAVVASYYLGPQVGAALFASYSAAATAAGTAIVAGVVNIAGGLLVNALLPAETAKTPGTRDQNDSASYGLDGPKPTSQEELPVPITYGLYRQGGNRINYYADNAADGKTQTLYAQFAVSEGEIEDITDLLVNDQPVANFQDITWDKRLGTLTQAPLGWFANTVTPYAHGGTISQTDIIYNTVDAVDRLRVDVTLPNGLFTVDKKSGDRHARAVTINVSATPVGGGGGIVFSQTGWTGTAFDASGAVSAPGGGLRLSLRASGSSGASPSSAYSATVKVYAQPANPDGSLQAEQLVLDDTRSGVVQNEYVLDGTWRAGSIDYTLETPIQPAGTRFRVAITGAAVLSTEVRADAGMMISRNERNPVRASFDSGPLPRGKYVLRVSRGNAETTSDYAADKAVLAAVNEIIADPLAYRRTAYYAIRARLSEQFSSEPVPTVLVKGRKVRIYDANGAVTAVQWSDNPADIALDMLLHPDWGSRLQPSRIDFPAFVRWRAFCAANGLKFNGTFDYLTTLWDALMVVARVGRGMPLVGGLRWTVAIEGPAEPVMMFGSQNIIKGSFKNYWVGRQGRANHIEVQYYDAADAYRRNSVFAIDQAALAAGEPLRQSTVNLIGVTTAAQAQKEADLQLALNQGIQQGCRFDAALDALGCLPGDVVYVQHDMPKWGWASRVKAISGTALTLENSMAPAGTGDPPAGRIPGNPDPYFRDPGFWTFDPLAWRALDRAPGNAAEALGLERVAWIDSSFTRTTAQRAVTSKAGVFTAQPGQVVRFTVRGFNAGNQDIVVNLRALAADGSTVLRNHQITFSPGDAAQSKSLTSAALPAGTASLQALIRNTNNGLAWSGSAAVGDLELEEVPALNPLPAGDWRILVLKPAIQRGSAVISTASGSQIVVPGDLPARTRRVRIGAEDYRVLDSARIGASTTVMLDRGAGSAAAGQTAEFWEVDALCEGLIAQPQEWTTSLTVTGWTHPAPIEAGDQLFIGRVDKYKRPFRVMKFGHGTEQTRSLDCIEYNEAVYSASGTVPVTNYSEIPGSPLQVLNLRADQLTETVDGGGLRYLARALWDLPLNDLRGHAGAKVWVSLNGAPYALYETVPAPGGESRFAAQPGDVVRFRVVAYDRSGFDALLSTAPTATVTLGRRARAPLPVANLSAEGTIKAIVVRWTLPDDADIKGVEVWEGLTATQASAYPVEQSDRKSFFTRTGLKTEDTRYYWVRTLSHAGEASPWAGPVSAKTSALLTEDIGQGILNTAKFAAGLEPVGLVNGLPALRGSNPTVVVNTQDNKLYRWDPTANAGAGAYVRQVAAVDISGSLADSQIASLSASKLAGSIVNSQIAPGAVDAANLRIGSAANLIWNPTCFAATDGWASGAGAGGVVGTLRPALTVNAGLALPTYGSGHLTVASVAAGLWCDLGWRPQGQRLPVKPGQRYEWQAKIALGAASCRAMLLWYDAGGNFLTQSLATTLPSSAAALTAASRLDQYTQVAVIADAPKAGVAGATVDAVFCVPVLRLYGPGGAGSAATNPVLVFSQALFGEALPNQATPSAWAGGGLTVIDGNIIRSGTLAGDRLVAKSVSANEIAAGAITTEKLSVGSASNLIWNPCCPNDAGGWALGGSPGGQIGPVSASYFGANRRLTALGSGGIFHGLLPANGWIDAMWAPNGTVSLLPTAGGEWWEFQARVKGWGVDAVQLKLAFYSASLAPLGETLLGTAASGPAGGWSSATTTTLDAYSLVWGKAQAPANAAFVLPIIRGPKASGGANAGVIWTQALLARGSANQAEPSPWSPGGVTEIGGGALQTGAITARALNADSVFADQGVFNSLKAGIGSFGGLTAGEIAAGAIRASHLGAEEIISDSIQVRNLVIGTQKITTNAVSQNYAAGWGPGALGSENAWTTVASFSVLDLENPLRLLVSAVGQGDAQTMVFFGAAGVGGGTVSYIGFDIRLVEQETGAIFETTSRQTGGPTGSQMLQWVFNVPANTFRSYRMDVLTWWINTSARPAFRFGTLTGTALKR